MREKLSTRAQDDNTHDKQYKSGIIANIGWPSNGQLAGRAIPVMLLTDYDRWPADIGGEGCGFEQVRKRTQTYGSLAMTVCESSPGSDWIDPKWQRRPGSHEAPPTTAKPRANILALYNAGDRRWWYVPCQACGEYYPQIPDISAFSWSEHPDPTKAAETAGAVCTHCGTVHPESTKRIENANGHWLAEGQSIDWQGHISGEARRTYPSYWLGGAAAAFQTRSSIVLKYLEALRELDRTGDETTLKTVVNTDIGAPYKPKSLSTKRKGSHYLMGRAEPVEKRTVPAGVRFLVAAIDVQLARFVVQVEGFGPHKERWIVDRYNLKLSTREGADGETLPIDPAAYTEDWEVLMSVIGASYPLCDGSGRKMPVLVTGCDSGGRDGVTEKAYEFWRRIRDRGLAAKFALLKGASQDSAPRVKCRHPDSRDRSDRNAGSIGDVPVYFLNTTILKDTLAGDLERENPGPGYIHFPSWLGAWWYEELTREEKDPVKGWVGAKGNEAFDLMVYCDALALELGIESIDWKEPPAWAAEWNNNPYVSGALPVQTGPRLSIRTGNGPTG